MSIKDIGYIGSLSISVINICSIGYNKYFAWFQFSPVGDVICLRVSERFYEYCFCSGVPTCQWLRYHGQTQSKK